MEPSNIDYRLRIPSLIETACLTLMFEEELRAHYPELGIEAWLLWNQKDQMDCIVRLILKRIETACPRNEGQSVQIVIDTLAESLADHRPPTAVAGTSNGTIRSACEK